MKIDDLRGRPWRFSPLAPVLLSPKGMIGPDERSCYYWLGKNWLSGAGCIIDAGSFVGASTFCLAAGAADGQIRSFAGRQLIHAYDYFAVVDEYVGDAISRDFRPISAGESYIDIFQSQIAPYADMVKIYAGDFLAHRWHGDPIEILFIDIAKTERLNAHVISQFFPSLIPGRSVIIHQDYFHCWHPYIHISMQFFSAEFELIDELVPYQSRVWRLVKPLSPAKVARMSRYDLTPQERLALLDELIGNSSEQTRPMNEVVRVWQLCLDKDWMAAKAALSALRQKYDIDSDQALWAKQALEVEMFVVRNLSK